MNVTFVESFQSKIFDFYQQNRRSFPWRMTTDRYAIMVSEVMLQQTQTDRVARRFPLWLERFPDVRSLASASLREVLDAWSGLGYNSRGQRLHRAAAMVVEQFDGQVPEDPTLLIELPGIGAYTSRSIPVFADNLDIAAVDTNIWRVLIYELNLPESITPKALMGVAEEVLPKGRSRDWHNALMDYGAQELTAKKTGIAPLTRQSSFKGSRRWYRSALLRELLASGELSRESIEERYADCPHDIGSIVDSMVMESMIEEYGEQRMLRIAGELGGGGEREEG
ncbi:MAG TPA: Fe-S cluster assembly protein HesB [Chlorobaculum parvum]|uniref:Fe-S cluster assembly protein HesB n=1 Tax=Chlorobaculum parvum TaxID=274539 RepID=A0A7C5DFJ9_9CHLB|nr:Fe-S cluster assembly protein HesB [Chlorobaculum parvum]